MMRSHIAEGAEQPLCFVALDVTILTHYDTDASKPRRATPASPAQTNVLSLIAGGFGSVFSDVMPRHFPGRISRSLLSLPSSRFGTAKRQASARTTGQEPNPTTYRMPSPPYGKAD